MLQALTPFLMIIAAVILGTDRSIIRALRAERAYSPETAVPLPPRNALWSWRMRRLTGRKALVFLGDGDLVYLDDAAWQSFRSWRRRRVVIVLAIVVPLMLLFSWLASRTDWFSSDI